MTPRVCHLFDTRQHRLAAAILIHNEFWTEVPGASAPQMATRLGTDGPCFYERLGAVVHHVPRAGFCFMRFDL